MEFILDLSPQESSQVLSVIQEHRETFKANAHALFDDAFLVLTSSAAKNDQF